MHPRQNKQETSPVGARNKVYTVLVAGLAIYGGLQIALFPSTKMLDLTRGGVEKLREGTGMYNLDTVESDVVESDIVESDVVEHKCLSLESGGGMDQLLSKYKQVYTLQEPKVSSSTFTSFARLCNRATKTTSFEKYRKLPSSEEMKATLLDQLKMPSLVNARVMDDVDNVCSLMRHATQTSLIILNYREELSRLLSAIKHVASTKCYRDGAPGFKVLEDGCQVNEGALAKIIERRAGEIFPLGIFQCKLLKCIQENSPNLVIMNYNQTTPMVNLLSKHHCPAVKGESKNVAGSEKESISVVLQGPKTKGTIVALSDWLDAKSEMLALAFFTKVEQQSSVCQTTKRRIERKLFACPDGTLQISGRSYEDQEIQFPF